MRRLIINAVLLLGTFTVLYLGVFTLLVKVRRGGVPLVHHVSETLPWKGGATWRKFQEFDPAQRWDVVVVGSSHAYRGYDPALFAARGCRMFNLGTSAQAPSNSIDIIRAYLNAGNTGLLILDVFETPMRNDGVEGVTDLTRNVASDALAFRQALSLRDPRAINMLALRWLTRNDPPTYLDDDYIGAGFSRRTDSVPAPIQYINPGTFEPDAAQVRALKGIIKLCRDRNIPLVLACHPMPHQGDRLAHARFLELMHEWRGPEGPLFLDFATGHDLHDMHHFYDHNHLNQAGVERYVPLLLDSLEALELLPCGAAR